jgi:hypothetical protein
VLEIFSRNFFDVYSSVVNVKAFRMFLAIWCLSPDHQAEQWDITAAFLHAMIKESIYLKLNDEDLERYFGIPKSQSSKNNYLLKLIKCLYGLRQSSREWYQLLRKLLIDCGCVPIVKDDCLYVKRVGEAWVIILVHVDDMSVFFNGVGKALHDYIYKHLAKHISSKPRFAAILPENEY